MVFAPGLHFINVFQWFLTSGLLWAPLFNVFSILLLGGLFRASFLQCFSTLLLRIPPRASLPIWFLTCIQCSYGSSPLLPQAFSLGPGLLYYLQDRFSSLTASISITWSSMGLDSFWGRAWLQSVIAHFVEPAECIFNFSEFPYFSLFWCRSFPKLRCRTVCRSFCPKFSVGLHLSRRTTSCCLECCPGLHSKSLTCVDFQTNRRPQRYNCIFSIFVLGLVATCGLASFRPRGPHSPIVSRSFAVQVQTDFSSYACAAGRFNNSLVRSATISLYCC